VPPIYQPEVAAQAIIGAADRPNRREYWVGAPTVGTIVANRFIPGLLDRYLARTGYESQQTDEVVTPNQPANLWHPVDRNEDHGAHGSFDYKSHERSPQAWLSRHRGLVGAGASAAAAGAAFAATALRRR